ncbi:MAG: biotin--[acetyl-CoA-carboxylase] ligase [Sandaracinaceae bacterium]
MSDLSAEGLAEALGTERYGRSLSVLAETDSTNDDARRAALDGAPDGHVVLADHQRAGRGARGATWSSPAGSDLYLSIVCRAPLPLSALAPLTLAVGLGVVDTVDTRVAQPVQVKWPNDVHIGEKKCAGVLVESLSIGDRVESLVIGIGLDVNRAAFQSELAPIATSLRQATSHTHDRTEVCADLLAHVERWVDRFVSDGAAAVVPSVEARLAWRGEHVDAGGREGVLTGLGPDGSLLIQSGNEVMHVRSGTLRRVDA